MMKTWRSAFLNRFGWGGVDDDSSDDDDVGIEENEEENPFFDELLSIVNSQDENVDTIAPNPIVTNSIKTAHRNGVITRLSATDGVIDDKYFFDRGDAPQMNLDVGKTVTYSATRMSEEQEWKITKIYIVHDDAWSDEETDTANVEQETKNLEEDIILKVNESNMRTIVGKVQVRDGREVVVRDQVQLCRGGERTRDTRFHLDNVNSDFLPLAGDIVSMRAHVEVSEETVDASGDIIQVMSVVPSRARRTDGVVTYYHRKYRWGDIDDNIFFEISSLSTGYIPKPKDEVSVEIIECMRTERQDRRKRQYGWRALSVKPHTLSQHFEENERVPRKSFHQIDPELVRDKGNIVVQEHTDFGRFPISGNYDVGVSVTNQGETRTVITNHYIETERSNLIPINPRVKKVIIEPRDTVTFSFKFRQNLLGFFSEIFVIEFEGLQVGRLIKWEVYHPDILDVQSTGANSTDVNQDVRRNHSQEYMSVQNDRLLWIPGVRPITAPSFVKVRFGIYPMPSDIKSAMAVGTKTWLESQRESRELIKKNYPELIGDLSSANHLKRLHTLLFISEMDATIDLCRYTKKRVSFVRRGPASEFLALEMPGLSEGRPSLIVGDSIVAMNCWAENHEKSSGLQGFVHRILQNEIWVKFNPHFHNTYNSEDYDVYFLLSRSCYRKLHAALDHCHKFQSNLWLFPKGVKAKPPLILYDEPEGYIDGNLLNNSNHVSENCVLSVNNLFESFKSSPPKSGSLFNTEFMHVKDIENSHINLQTNAGDVKDPKTGKPNLNVNGKTKLTWFNKRLNHRQKEAVRNILLGEARPLPYIIFGPPGTGKTMTLVETILQIYMLMKDSRLLVATPSNSSANLIAERLLASGLFEPGDMVRLVANHLITDGKIPVELVPYCRTVNISASQTKDENESGGIGSLGANLIMCHRITIGTCMTLGSIMQLGLPRGHYTHIIADESGQASEPEILIPLGFMAHESGQTILAGDPHQLGPVVQSHLAASFGLDRSLLSRLLPRFPYQRDATGFPDSGGYDPRLVTRLTANYRSLPDILELPSTLFYDSDLDPMVSEEYSYEAKLLARAVAQLEFPHSAVVFKNIKGHTRRDSDSPSFWNPQEMYEVFQCVRKLLNAQIKPEDIGIITPYQKQVAKIRQLIIKLTDVNEGGHAIKVGSVEEFQGQERMVIILSTVRSTGQDHIENIGRHTAKQLLGFVSNPERLNVAISRARALLIVVGDAEVLCVDHYWRSVVKYCVDKGSLVGAAAPKHLLDYE